MPIVPVRAPAPDSRYDIHIGHGLLGSCAALLSSTRLFHFKALP